MQLGLKNMKMNEHHSLTGGNATRHGPCRLGRIVRSRRRVGMAAEAGGFCRRGMRRATGDQAKAERAARRDFSIRRHVGGRRGKDLGARTLLSGQRASIQPAGCSETPDTGPHAHMPILRFPYQCLWAAAQWAWNGKMFRGTNNEETT